VSSAISPDPDGRALAVVTSQEIMTWHWVSCVLQMPNGTLYERGTMPAP